MLDSLGSLIQPTQEKGFLIADIELFSVEDINKHRKLNKWDLPEPGSKIPFLSKHSKFWDKSNETFETLENVYDKLCNN